MRRGPITGVEGEWGRGSEMTGVEGGGRRGGTNAVGAAGRRGEGGTGDGWGVRGVDEE